MVNRGEEKVRVHMNVVPRSTLNMKSWQLTLICVPHLKAVLSAVECTQQDFYSIDRNFEELEQELRVFGSDSKT